MTGHWVHTLAILILIITGAIAFFPGIDFSNNTLRFFHRVSAIVGGGTTVLYISFNARVSWNYVKDTFTWETSYLKWLLTAAYRYFGGDRSKMPSHDIIDAGHQLWRLVMVTTGLLFFSTGFMMWFFKESFPQGVFTWFLFIHDLSFLSLLVTLPIHMIAKAAKPVITAVDCIECNICVSDCPREAIFLYQGQPIVSHNDCAYCGNCIQSCPRTVFGIEYIRWWHWPIEGMPAENDPRLKDLCLPHNHPPGAGLN